MLIDKIAVIINSLFVFTLVVGFASSTKIKKGQLYFPCEPLTVGTHKTFVLTRNNGILYQDVYISEVRNNLIRTISTTKENLLSDSFSQKSTHTYLKDTNTTFLTEFTSESHSSVMQMSMKYNFKKPQPSCGEIPIFWKDSIVYESTIGGYRQIVNLEPQEVNVKYLDDEEIAVPAGKFLTSVFEKWTNWKDNNGSVTVIDILYMSKRVGLVKQTTIRIQKNKIIEIEANKELEEKMKSGILELQKGKKITDIDFFKDSGIHTTQEKKLAKMSVFKTIQNKELLSIRN